MRDERWKLIGETWEMMMTVMMMMMMMVMVMMMMMMMGEWEWCGRWCWGWVGGWGRGWRCWGGWGWQCGRWGGGWQGGGWWCCGRWGGRWWCQGGGRWWCWGGPIPRLRPTLFASLRNRNAQNSHFLRNFTSKMLYRAPDTTSALCEPAQSKCTWTCHRSHFMRKFTGKMPEPRLSTPIKHRRKPSVDVFCLK